MAYYFTIQTKNYCYLLFSGSFSVKCVSFAVFGCPGELSWDSYHAYAEARETVAFHLHYTPNFWHAIGDFEVTSRGLTLL